MAIFGVKSNNQEGKEYLDLYRHRLERPPISFILNGQGLAVKKDVYVYVVEPRVPKLHYLGIGLLCFFLFLGWLRWWMAVPIVIMVLWGAFWLPKTYYYMMRWGIKGRDTLEYVGSDEAMRSVMDKWDSKKSTRGY